MFSKFAYALFVVTLIHLDSFELTRQKGDTITNHQYRTGCGCPENKMDQGPQRRS